MFASQASLSRQLPSKPNFEQLKNQAKDLLNAHKSGVTEACQRIRTSLRRLSKASVAEIRDARFTLRDAQSVIAREYGFGSWAKLSVHVEALSGTGAVKAQVLKMIPGRFEDAAKIIRSMQGDPQQIAILLVALGQDNTAGIMRYLSDGEIERAAQAIAGLSSVSAEAQDQALSVFAHRLQTGELADEGAGPEYGDFVLDTLEQALGPRKAAQILNRRGLALTRKAGKRKPKLSKQHLAMKRSLKKQLQGTPSLNMGLDEIREVMVKMGEIARAAGILALEDLFPGPPFDDPTKMEELFRLGMMMSIDGTQPEMLTEMLDNQKHTMMHNFETRCKMIIAGITAIREGDNPRIIDQKLRFFYDHQDGLPARK